MTNQLLPAIFDVDGVLADFVLHFTRLANKHFPQVRPISTGAQPSWMFATDGGWDDTQLWDFIRQATGWWEACPILVTPGDLEAMHEVASVRDIVYLTSRTGRHPRTETMRWLADRDFPVGKVIVSHDKVGEIQKLGGAWGILEDRPDNITELKDAGVWTVARDWQYNRHVKSSDRVSSVAEFCDRVLGR